MEELFINGGPCGFKRNIETKKASFRLDGKMLEDYYLYADNLSMYKERYFVEVLEKKMAEFIYGNDNGYSIAIASCTSALKLALIALGIGKGDEVIVPAFTFVSDMMVVTEVNASPVFVDIRLDSFCIDYERIEEKISSKTKAIIIVHLFGVAANIDEILRIANKHNLYVIEDCAHALGSTYKGKKVGSFGHLSCFSFNQTKLISAEEGGMVLTKDDKLANTVKILINNGLNDNGVLCGGLGYSYRMTNLQGYILLKQLEKIHDIIFLNKQCTRKYFEILNDKFLVKNNNKDICYLFYPVLLKEGLDDQIKWIKNMMFFERIPFINTNDIPLPYLYENRIQNGMYPEAEKLCKRIVKFYTHSQFTNDVIDEISFALDKILYHSGNA